MTGLDDNTVSLPETPPSGRRPRAIVAVAGATVLILMTGVAVAVLLTSSPDREAEPRPEGTESLSPSAPQSAPTFHAPAPPAEEPEAVQEESTLEDEESEETSAPRTPQGPGPDVGQILAFDLTNDPEGLCAGTDDPDVQVPVEFRYRTENAVEAGFGIDTNDGIYGAYLAPLALPDGAFTLQQSCTDPQTYAFTVKGKDGIHHTRTLSLFQKP